jgi:hypothetical protein
MFMYLGHFPSLTLVHLYSIAITIFLPPFHSVSLTPLAVLLDFSLIPGIFSIYLMSSILFLSIRLYMVSTVSVAMFSMHVL